MTPEDLDKLQEEWYDKLRSEGFKDAENFSNGREIKRHDQGQPQFHNRKQQHRDSEGEDPNRGTDTTSIHYSTEKELWQFKADYYTRAQTFAANWPSQWIRSDKDRIEKAIWQAHSQGLKTKEIMKYCVDFGAISKNTVDTTIVRYRIILLALDFDLVEDWNPGKAVGQLMRLQPGLKKIVEDCRKHGLPWLKKHGYSS